MRAIFTKVRMPTRHARQLWRRVWGLRSAGMTTAEYAVGTIAAVTFAGLLIAVLKSGVVQTALSAIITSALSARA